MTPAWAYWLTCATVYFIIAWLYFHQMKDAFGLLILMLLALLVLFFLLIGVGG